MTSCKQTAHFKKGAESLLWSQKTESSSAVGVTQSKNGFQRNGEWEGMADYTCQIDEYRSTDEMLGENKDGAKRSQARKNLNETKIHIQ